MLENLPRQIDFLLDLFLVPFLGRDKESHLVAKQILSDYMFVIYYMLPRPTENSMTGFHG